MASGSDSEDDDFDKWLGMFKIRPLVLMIVAIW